MTGSARAHRTARFVAGATLLLSYSGGCAVSEEVDHTLGGFPSVSGGSGGNPATSTGGTIGNTGGTASATGGTLGAGGSKASGGLVGTGGRVSSGGTSATGGSKASTGGRGSATGGRGSTTGGRGSATGGATATGGASAGGKSSATGGVTGSGGSAGKSGGTGGKSGGCDWDACTQLKCATACPTTMGTYCADACDAIITCLKANPTCGTTADPMCVNRTNGSPNECTTEWESASGPASPPGAPAKAATDYFECACGAAPSGSGGATGTGGARSTGGRASTGGGKGA